MADVKWTKEQQSVLDVRNKNVLVSAAAGSGKTAVLVERIIKIVTEDKKDIDKQLVVTFTNAAAAEMRERILAALEKKARENKDDEHVLKQISYIHNAQITTIDSFCLNVVRQYFSAISIDPGFTIGDTGELKLIKEDVMKEMLEEYYTNGDSDFLEFVDDYSDGRTDKQIEEIIIKLYEFSMSYPYPEEWLNEVVKQYDFEEESIEEKQWYKFIIYYLDECILDIHQSIKMALNVIRGENGPINYEEALLSDEAFILQVLGEKDYNKRVDMFSGFKAKALSRAKMPQNTDDSLKEYVKELRNGIKKDIEDIKKKFYSYNKEIILRDTRKCKIHANVLVNLTKDFANRYKEAKNEKNIIDFSDMEHMALEILVKKEDGKIVPSDIAKEISEDIDEIMIDEYQDSNLVQETILMAVSKMHEGKNNIFMVGDVKQSIYKFRLARPELFLEKYDTYATDDDSDTKKIVLSKNFRSRKQVLDGTNKVFEKIMLKELGGIEYDSENALYPGAKYDDYNVSNEVELLLADTQDSKKADEEDNKELEAAMVADRINELIESGYLIKDKETGKERKLQYKDIAILLRSFGEYGEAYSNVLASKGIPAKTPTGTGYFDTYEVQTMLHMLSIIDNPRQDIPLASVMKNMMGFSDNELAKIKSECKESDCFYDALTGSEDEKVKSFLEMLYYFREKANYTSIHDLIEEILNKTGFKYFILAMKAGKKRYANIEMLKEKAVVYEDISYSGLFNFVRYIENLKKYEVDQGEADIVGGGDFVTLMTIHKSKGLEFPVVIVGAMCKKFNTMDEHSNVVLHHDLGVGLNYVDRASGIKAKTLIKESISKKIHEENMAEELRVFYVAMTRAKEKLILAGATDVEKVFEKYNYLREEDNEKVRKNVVVNARNYLELVVMAMKKTIGSSGIFLTVKQPKEIVLEVIKSEQEKTDEFYTYKNWNAGHVYNKNIKEEIERLYDYRYPYENDLDIKGKVSVSDIKHMFMEKFDEEPDAAEKVSGFEEEDKPIPSFLKEKEMIGGAKRGTAYHRFFELLDYGKIGEVLENADGVQNRELLRKEINRQFETFEKEGLADKEYFERGFINKEKYVEFLFTGLGKRMLQAAKNGKLFRERQFVIGLAANLTDEKYSEDEIVLVQGIIDAYFEEDDKLILVDYKTDNVGSLKELEERYKSQMDYYTMALEKIMGKPVSEKFFYSVKFNKEYKII